MINILHIHESNNGKSFAYIIPVQEYKAVKRSKLFGTKKVIFRLNIDFWTKLTS